MGCHTWFYKKVEDNISYDDIRDVVYNDYLDVVNINKGLLSGDIDDYIKEMYSDISVDHINNSLLIAERMCRMIQNNFCKVAVCKRFRYKNNLTDFTNNSFYYTNDKLPHDLFRIGGYPEDILFSLEDTYKFIESNKDKIYFNIVVWEDKIKTFWKDNPNGMIKFG
jgi:hypothetical protein